ncbi:hypothetical protein G6O69_25810 [Pseudenhygromyxa sp. WMMC2535]|uniref:hypothetical protein n=1 Tax=Pseudenhygromyxa sp. WMMC2535 TaxID=2712867 RepID=UPI0015568FEA|nr:hypothetical protein [Pseudenhygromyxa sp. WMMC2535]NVB41282.1 hypothetical protein [Pseudenhygromyxa sp. WMMC2535]
MMRSKKSISILTLLLPAAAVVLLSPARGDGAQIVLTPLCNSVYGACELSPPDAPLLEAEVCWNGTETTLKSGDCATGSRAFALQYGEVIDPVNQVVMGLKPVPNACDHGFCSPMPDGQEPSPDEGFLCCGGSGEPCSVADDDICTMGDLLYCFDYTESDSGVTCHDEE